MHIDSMRCFKQMRFTYTTKITEDIIFTQYFFFSLHGSRMLTLLKFLEYFRVI